MVFSSLTFLMVFLPLTLLFYYIVPFKFKNTVLFICSMIFYAWGEPVYVVLMVISTVLDYTCGRMIEKYRNTPKAKWGLILSMVGNIGMLCFFKYTSFLVQTINGISGLHIPVPQITLPIGISFYTFQTMSYTIDVYRGEIEAQKNIISFGAYVSLFPQLIAGPIVRYQTIAEQIDYRKHSFDKFAAGVKRFIVGLGKKVLLANNMGILWNYVSTRSGSQTTVMAWVGIFAYAFQIYFDFSGYSDMAIGLGKMFGFDFCENFDYPYTSRSITEFWRRWHISMGTWFRDYVYIPLGGNKKGKGIQLRNIFIVWMLTGLWHGASWNFVVWGLFYGIILICEKLFLGKILEKIPRFFSHVYAIFFILIGWTIFAFDNFGNITSFLGSMFGINCPFSDSETIYQILSYLPLILLCVLFSMPICKKLYKKVEAVTKDGVMCTVDIAVSAVIMILCTAFLISGSYNPFLYFRF